MPKYVAPNTDASRLTFMSKAVETAETAKLGGTVRIPDAIFAELTAHYATFKTAVNAAQSALEDRKEETAESAAAMAKLKLYISHMWTAVHHRALREGQSARIFGYYHLNSDGTQPVLTNRRERLLMAEALLAGDANAVAAGYAPIGFPSAAELQVVYDAAMAQVKDVPQADAAYDEAQTAVSALRPEADRLIKEVRDAIVYSTRNMDAPSQRRVLRNHGARYYYLPDENVDAGDETAVFEVGVG